MTNEDKEAAAARSREKKVFARLERHGHESKLEQERQKVLNGHPPYEVLGRDGSKIVLYSSIHGWIVELSSRVSPAEIFLMLAPPEVLQQFIHEGASMKDRELASAVVRDIGGKINGKPYDPAKVRGAGIWRDPEGIIYSTGRDCYLLREGEAKAYLVYPLRPDGTLYTDKANKPNIPPPADTALTNDEGKDIYDMLAARSWGETYAADMLAGWVIAAPLSGILPIRPHTWINGETNKGKSALMKDLHAVHGGCHEKAKGTETTPVSLRNKADGKALPFYFDEVDTDGRHWKNERALDYASLLRIASDGDEGASRAGEGDTVKTARLRSCFCLTSIRNSLTHAQDYNRFILLSLEDATAAEIDKLEARRAAGYTLLERADTPARLITRCMQQARYILHNTETITARLRAAGIAGRRALMDGVLLACRWALTDGGEITTEYLAYCDSIAKTAEVKAQADCRPVHEELLDAILSHPCMTSYPKKMNVRQAAQAVFFPQGDDLSKAGELAGLAESALKSFAMHPRQADARSKGRRAKQGGIIIDYQSKAFAPVLERTQWRGGHGIPAAIKGAPHAEVKNCWLHGRQTNYLVIYEDAFRDDFKDDET